jgi:hypothetical protein
MGSREMQNAALVTREAHQALLDLKKLVRYGYPETYAAELEVVGQAVCSPRTTRRCSGSTRWRWPQGSRLRRLHRKVVERFPRPILRLACPSAERIPCPPASTL